MRKSTDHHDPRPTVVISSSASAHSLHDLEADPPPAYDDVVTGVTKPSSSRPESSGGNNNNNNNNITSPLTTDDYFIPDRKSATGLTTARKSKTVTLAQNLSVDKHQLYKTIKQQANLPPRPHLVIQGSHTETRSNHHHHHHHWHNSKKNGGSEKKETVIDFAFRVDLTESVLTGWEGDGLDGFVFGSAWHLVSVVEDGDGVVAFRGGRWRQKESRRWPSASASVSTPVVERRERGEGGYVDDDDDDDDDGDYEYEDEALLRAEEGDAPSEEEELSVNKNGSGPMLLGWCERFCNDRARVKSFTLTRGMQGLDLDTIRSSLTRHIRTLNYRGHIDINLDLTQNSVTIYSPHWINRLRNNPFSFWICITLQLWLITWPIILLLERRYEVVQSTWYASKTCMDEDDDDDDDDGSRSRVRRGRGRMRKMYARGRDESRLAEWWAPAVKMAAWNKLRCDGEGQIPMTEQDAMQAWEQQQGREGGMESLTERDRRERVNQGQGTFTDSVVGLVRGVSEVWRDWDMARGWGEDR